MFKMPFFLAYDPAISACFLALLMGAGWWIGAGLGRRGASPDLTRFDDAALALSGLLLAFCFSGAAARYDIRKSLVLDEATAIGDFAGTIAVLAEPERARLIHELRTYVRQRQRFGELRFDHRELLPLLARTNATQNRMAMLVASAVRTGNASTVHEPLIDTWNRLTTSYARRSQGLRDHMPDSIVLMLVAFAVFSAFTMGREVHRARGGPALMYIALVSMVFWVTLDLEMPRRGFVRVSQQSMQDLTQHLPVE